MIRVAVITALCIGCLLAAPGGTLQALAGLERPHCDVCGRYTDKSPCRIKATEKIGNHSLAIDVCSLFCYAERLEDVKGEVESILVLDSTTLKDDVPVMLSVGHATFLYGTTGDEQKTAKPFVLAFTSKKAAETARNTVGGELITWDDALASCVKLAADYEPPQPGGGYEPLRKHRRQH
jgi:hypothetical protein